MKVKHCLTGWSSAGSGMIAGSLPCCLMLHGWAYRYKVLTGGGRQILSLHVPGDMPDLLSLHLPVMDHNLGVLTTSTIGLIEHKDMNALATRFPNLAAAL